MSPPDAHFVGNCSQGLCHSNAKLTHTPAHLPKGCVQASIWLQTNQSTLGAGAGAGLFLYHPGRGIQTEAVNQLEGKCFVVLATSIAAFHASCLGYQLSTRKLECSMERGTLQRIPTAISSSFASLPGLPSPGLCIEWGIHMIHKRPGDKRKSEDQKKGRGDRVQSAPEKRKISLGLSCLLSLLAQSAY